MRRLLGVMVRMKMTLDLRLGREKRGRCEGRKYTVVFVSKGRITYECREMTLPRFVGHRTDSTVQFSPRMNVGSQTFNALYYNLYFFQIRFARRAKVR